ncbi:hypothetical protein ABZ815_52700 [Nonomuraea sp. NPDC047529]|uniref:hypothetical protein n=1 Tax=Nonomuraea sp. NPDC047529 TaxID=3155623 RepID=UPI0033FBE485
MPHRNAPLTELGRLRLARCAGRLNDGLNAEQTLERITTALSEYAGDHHSDDTALVLLRVPFPAEERP